MKIKKILGFIVFAFVCVLALASCGGSFETKVDDITYSGDLYVNAYNNYCLISGDKIYSIQIYKNNNQKELKIDDLRYEKVDDYTWKKGFDSYFVLINNGQELMGIGGTNYVYFYTKTDHIEGLQEG